MTATPDGYNMCPRCGHHTSACAGGVCTVFVLLGDSSIGYCGCDCYKALHGTSLFDEIFDPGRGPGGDG